MKPSSSNQMSEQFQSVLPAPVENSFQIIGSQPNPNHHNSDPFPASTPNPNLGLPDSLSIPRKRKRGRVTRKPSSLVFHNPAFPPFSLLNGNNFNGNNELVSYSSSSSSSANVKPLPTAVVENSTASQAPSVAPDISEEIIFINKEATAEALIALSAGFPADSLTDEEIEAGVVSVIGGIEQVNYILIRNHILARWRENVTNWLTKESLSGAIPQHCDTLLNSAYNYLLSHGYINFGVAPTIKEKIPAAATKPNVIVIGAGLAGLAAARQLMAFGFKVIILEGRKRAGGRVYTKKMEGSNRSAAAELGGSVLTGTLGNPLGILAKQLSYPMHKVRDKCPLYSPDGKPVDPDIDSKVETAFNRLLDHASKLRQLMGEVSVDVSLGAALDIFQEVYGDTVNAEEMNLFHWHLANLEYANAGLLSKLSFAFWDQDDPYDMGGDHCFLPGGNGRLVQALVENLNILYEKTVHTIRYGSEGVQVVAGPQVFEGDMALCTVPLGVLKNGSIKFIPELPQRKLDGIKRLGFGLLNKVAMLFPHVFWGNDLDTFGHLSEDPSRRGEFFLFYSYATVAGGPVLIALVAGEAALKFESMAPTDAVTRVLQILKGIYEPQGIDVPEPIQTVCTRWGSDPFSLGSYSNVAVGASGDDYDILAENVGDGRLFFAGEATTRRYPATMHGAFLSGLREAASMANHANARSLQIKIERSPSKDAQSCASLLADLFREPDLEFGSFAVIFGPISDIKSMAIMRVMFSGPRKKNNEGSKPDQQHSNKLLFQQLQSHFNQQQQLHVYTLLSTQQVLELREVRGGDEARLNYLSEKLGVKLVGRRGLGSAADSVIAAIKAERGNRRPPSTSRALKSGTPKQKASSSKLALVRRAKVVTGSSNSARPPARPPLPALVRMPAPAPAPSQATAIASSPSTAMAIVSVPAPAPSLSLAPAPARPPVPTPARMPAPAQSTAPVLAPFQATAVASASSMATAPAPVLSRSPALALTQPPVPISALSPALAPSQMEAPALASAPAPAPSQATTTALSPAPSLATAPALSRAPSLATAPALSRAPSLATAPALSRAPSLASSLALSQALPLTLSPAPSPSIATAPALSQASSPNPVPSSFPIPSHSSSPAPSPSPPLATAPALSPAPSPPLATGPALSPAPSPPLATAPALSPAPSPSLAMASDPSPSPATASDPYPSPATALDPSPSLAMSLAPEPAPVLAPTPAQASTAPALSQDLVLAPPPASVSVPAPPEASS